MSSRIANPFAGISNPFRKPYGERSLRFNDVSGLHQSPGLSIKNILNFRSSAALDKLKHEREGALKHVKDNIIRNYGERLGQDVFQRVLGKTPDRITSKQELVLHKEADALSKSKSSWDTHIDSIFNKLLVGKHINVDGSDKADAIKYAMFQAVENLIPDATKFSGKLPEDTEGRLRSAAIAANDLLAYVDRSPTEFLKDPVDQNRIIRSVADDIFTMTKNGQDISGENRQDALTRAISGNCFTSASSEINDLLRKFRNVELLGKTTDELGLGRKLGVNMHESFVSVYKTAASIFFGNSEEETQKRVKALPLDFCVALANQPDEPAFMQAVLETSLRAESNQDLDRLVTLLKETIGGGSSEEEWKALTEGGNGDYSRFISLARTRGETAIKENGDERTARSNIGKLFDNCHQELNLSLISSDERVKEAKELMYQAAISCPENWGRDMRKDAAVGALITFDLVEQYKMGRGVRMGASSIVRITNDIEKAVRNGLHDHSPQIVHSSTKNSLNKKEIPTYVTLSKAINVNAHIKRPFLDKVKYIRGHISDVIKGPAIDGIKQGLRKDNVNSILRLNLHEDNKFVAAYDIIKNSYIDYIRPRIEAIAMDLKEGRLSPDEAFAKIIRIEFGSEADGSMQTAVDALPEEFCRIAAAVRDVIDEEILVHPEFENESDALKKLAHENANIALFALRIFAPLLAELGLEEEYKDSGVSGVAIKIQKSLAPGGEHAVLLQTFLDKVRLRGQALSQPMPISVGGI